MARVADEHAFYVVTGNGQPVVLSQGTLDSPASYEGCGHQHRTARAAYRAHRRGIDLGTHVVHRITVLRTPYGPRLEVEPVLTSR